MNGDGTQPAGSAFLKNGDILRIVTCFIVVLSHSSAYVWKHIVGEGALNWWVSNFYIANGRWTVPVFICLSGALLLDPSKTETASSFFRKRWQRLGIPFLFWCLVFYLLDLKVAPEMTIQTNVTRILAGAPFHHLYYLFALWGLYLITPPLRKVVKASTRQELAVYVLVTGLFALLSNLYNYFVVDFRPLPIFFKFIEYAPYFLAGSYLRTMKIGSKGLVYTGLIFGLALLATYFLNYAFVQIFTNTDIRSEYFLNFFSPNVLVMSVCVFLFLINLDIEKTRLGFLLDHPWVISLSEATLGIYIIHPILVYPLRNVSKLLHFEIYDYYWAWAPPMAVIIFILCYVATKITMKIPYLRRVF